MSKIGDYIINLEDQGKDWRDDYGNYTTIVPPDKFESEESMTTLDEIYPSKGGNSLKATDLQGREILVTIASHEVVDFNDGKKIVLTFTGKDKTLVTNKTNAKAIGAAFGEEPSGWTGKNIYLYPATTEYNNQTVPCIRVRPELPKADELNDDIPF